MNKIFYKIVFASILVSFLVNSCSTEDLKNEKNENIAAINKAEEYFNKNVIKLKDNIIFPEPRIGKMQVLKMTLY